MKPSNCANWHGIVGWLSPSEADHLYRRVTEVLQGNVVEIGSYRGRGTAALALACLGRETMLTTIDHHQGCPQFGVQDFSSEDHIRAALITVGCDGAPVTMLSMESTEAARQWQQGPIEFLFIDGAHEYEAVTADIAAWWPLVRNGSYVCFHDYAAGHGDGVIRAVNELCKAGKARITAHIGLIAEVRKID